MSLLGKWFGFSKDEIFDEGLSAYDRGDYEAAAETFADCLADASNTRTARLAAFYSGASHSRLGDRRMEEGAPGDALNQYRSALRSCPNYPDLHLRAARACEAMGERRDRDEHLARALKINPRYVDAIVFLGVCTYAEGRYEEGLSLIEQACELDRELDTEHLRLGKRLHDEGLTARALANLRQMTLCASGNAALHLRVGDSFLRDGMLEEAVLAYSRALDLNPRDPLCHLKAGEALGRLRRYSEAVHHLDCALRLNPEDPEAHAQKGELLRMMEREIDARCEFKRAAEIDPNHPVAMREGARLI